MLQSVCVGGVLEDSWEGETFIFEPPFFLFSTRVIGPYYGRDGEGGRAVAPAFRLSPKVYH